MELVYHKYHFLNHTTFLIAKTIEKHTLNINHSCVLPLTHRKPLLNILECLLNIYPSSYFTTYICFFILWIIVCLYTHTYTFSISLTGILFLYQ